MAVKVKAGIVGILMLAGSTVFAGSVPAGPFLHPLFSDNMVLQRDLPIRVWGWTWPGMKVTVSLNGKSATAIGDGEGKWSACLDPFPSGGPYTLVVTGPEQATVKNVLIGDVWLCAGQSNMGLGITQVNHADAEIAGANYPHIRLLRMPNLMAVVPEPTAVIRWQGCTPESIRQMNFSAVAYFFARKLNRDLNVPIGVIEAEWGDTRAEAWTSARGLGTMNDFRDRVANLIQQSGNLSWETDVWWSQCDPMADQGLNWQSPGRDVSGWKTIVQPKRWDSSDLIPFDGLVRCRKDITIPPALAGKPALLELGPVNDADIAYVNGIKVGSGQGDNFRFYSVPAGRLKAGANTIAVCVFDGGGTAGGLYGLPEQMNLKIQNGAGIVVMNLAGDWRYEIGTSVDEIEPYPLQLEPYDVTLLYNGMIAPLVPFNLKGVAWYQGESNANDNRSIQYRTLLPTLIKDWRSNFNIPKLPFLVVQLAGYGEPVKDPTEPCRWAELREAQLLTTQKLPNCGLVVTADIGDSKNVHPKNKQDVGYRLALAAEGIVYGRKIEYSGPIYNNMKIEGRSIRLYFDHVGQGLVAKDSDLLTGFVLAGADGKFIPAKAVIDGPTVLVSAPSVSRPVAVRYNWAGFPRGNLYNRAGLPASPFRTDR